MTPATERPESRIPTGEESCQSPSGLSSQCSKGSLPGLFTASSLQQSGRNIWQEDPTSQINTGPTSQHFPAPGIWRGLASSIRDGFSRHLVLQDTSASRAVLRIPPNPLSGVPMTATRLQRECRVCGSIDSQ